MRNTFSHLLVTYVLALLVVALSGCASSPPSKFYQLSAVNGQTVETREVPRQGREIITIGPLRIPDYLDRPQIVTQSGKNELKLAEFDRWAGSIENDIGRVLVEDISAQLPRDRFFVIGWTPLLESQMAPSYGVRVHVNRFEGTLGGSVTLRAQWGIFGKDRDVLLYKEANIIEQVNGNSYDALVDAMSRTLERLSKDIADEMKVVVQKDNETRRKG